MYIRRGSKRPGLQFIAETVGGVCDCTQENCQRCRYFAELLIYSILTLQVNKIFDKRWQFSHSLQTAPYF